MNTKSTKQRGHLYLLGILKYGTSMISFYLNAWGDYNENAIKLIFGTQFTSVSYEL